MHVGPCMSEHVFDYILDKPIILVKRKDILGQFLSYGIGWTTRKWVCYNEKSKSYNGLEPSQKFYYQREWFDDMAIRLIDIDKRKFNVEKTIWFEDIPKFKVNGKLPLKQNRISNTEKINLLTNSDQFMDWFLEFVERRR